MHTVALLAFLFAHFFCLTLQLMCIHDVAQKLHDPSLSHPNNSYRTRNYCVYVAAEGETYKTNRHQKKVPETARTFNGEFRTVSQFIHGVYCDGPGCISVNHGTFKLGKRHKSHHIIKGNMTICCCDEINFCNQKQPTRCNKWTDIRINISGSVVYGQKNETICATYSPWCLSVAIKNKADFKYAGTTFGTVEGHSGGCADGYFSTLCENHGVGCVNSNDTVIAEEEETTIEGAMTVCCCRNNFCNSANMAL